MVILKKRKIGRKTYYYLEHSVERNGKISKKEKYLGSRVPGNLDRLKKQFLLELDEERWFPLFDRIKRGYSEERGKTPHTAGEKGLEAFSVRFTYDTQRIEGSRLTLRETSNLLERGITPAGKDIADVKEAEAHQKVFYEMLKCKKDLSLQAVLYWHKMLFQDTKPDIAGRIRTHQVMISGSRFRPPFPAEIYPLLKEFFGWYSREKRRVHPVQLAALVHLKFVTIHPFSDGNGRISRLMMNFILQRHGFPMLNIPYEKRAGYYNSLERSQLKRDEHTFLNWFFRRYTKEHRAHL